MEKIRNYMFTIRNFMNVEIGVFYSKGRDTNEALYNAMVDNRIILEDGDTIEIEEV